MTEKRRYLIDGKIVDRLSRKQQKKFTMYEYALVEELRDHERGNGRLLDELLVAEKARREERRYWKAQQ